MRALAYGLAALCVLTLIAVFVLGYAAIFHPGPDDALADAALLTWILCLVLGGGSALAFVWVSA